jgi:hypothetical protein
MSSSKPDNMNKPVETTSSSSGGDAILPAMTRLSAPPTTTYRPNSRTIHSAVSNIELHSQTKGKNAKTAQLVTPRYWQPPLQPCSQHPVHHHPKGPVPRVPIAPKEAATAATASSAWKAHPQSVYSSSAPSYYPAYGMPWYPWPAAPHQQQQQPYPYSHVAAGMSHIHGGNTRLPPKLPPTSPLQAVSPPSTQRQKPLPLHHHHFTPEATMTAYEPTTTTTYLSSPSPGGSSNSDNLPPLWSTATKATPLATALQSPWSALPASPPLFASTPLYHALGSSHYKPDNDHHHGTPTLPTTTPIKMSSEIATWHIMS